jgi:DNA-binding MarR family transcriptional regulator
MAHGLPPLSWYDVLWPLYRAREKRLRMNELAEEVVLSRTGLVRLVDRVEAAGLLRREPLPEDGRGSYVAITNDGAATCPECGPSTGGTSSTTSSTGLEPIRGA